MASNASVQNAICDDPKLDQLCQELKIQPNMIKYLKKLRDFEIVIVIDDSGSMTTKFEHSQYTRWDELCLIVKRVLKVAVYFDSNGVDIYFLNRQGPMRVKDCKEVDREFDISPIGPTPLARVLKNIFTSNMARRGRDKKLLVFVATDGEPTDDQGFSKVSELEHLMNETRQIDTTFVSFLLCADDPDSVAYLNEWDEKMRNVDVVQDYISERENIRQRRGANFPFSEGDYIVKALVGAIDPEIDRLDE